MWQVDGGDQGDWKWDQPEEEKPGSIGSVTKPTVKITDEDGYERIRRPTPRIIGQCMPEIFAVDTERPGDSITQELSKKRLRGDGCSKES